MHYTFDRLTADKIDMIEKDTHHVYICKGCKDLFEMASKEWNSQLIDQSDSENEGDN